MGGRAAASDEEVEFNAHLRQRIKQAREDAELTQAEVARILSISLNRYKQYENRSPMPLYLAVRFCEVLDVPMWWLCTGRFRRYSKRLAGIEQDTYDPTEQTLPALSGITRLRPRKKP